MSILEKGTIVVTGGAGFIGSALIWALNRRGYHNILAVDMLGCGDKFKNLVPLRFIDYLEADDFIELVKREDDLLANVRTIFHLGANSSTQETDNRHLIRNNYEYTKTLAEYAIHRYTRFVYASSAATYGDGACGMDDQTENLRQFQPLNMYGYSKHLFDLYAQRQGWLTMIVGLKYFNVFGPNENHKGEMRSLVNKAVSQIQSTGQVKLFKSHRPDYEDGEQMRDFLYVKDAVEMTIHLAESRKANGLFNLGSGEANTWIDLVTPMFAAMNKPVDIDFIPMPETLREKYQYYTCADISKLRASGYDKPITPLPDAVTDYVTTYLLPGQVLQP